MIHIGSFLAGTAVANVVWVAVVWRLRVAWEREEEVLRRVSVLMARYIDEEGLQNVSMIDWILEARRELESEGRDE